MDINYYCFANIEQLISTTVCREHRMNTGYKNEYVRPAIRPQNNFAYVQYAKTSLYGGLLNYIGKFPYIEQM